MVAGRSATGIGQQRLGRNRPVLCVSDWLASRTVLYVFTKPCQLPNTAEVGYVPHVIMHRPRYVPRSVPQVWDAGTDRSDEDGHGR